MGAKSTDGCSGYSSAPERDSEPQPDQDDSSSVPLTRNHKTEKHRDRLQSPVHNNTETMSFQNPFITMRLNLPQLSLLTVLGVACGCGGFGSASLIYGRASPFKKASVVIQVGGWGNTPFKDIEELYRPSTPECNQDRRVVPDLPVPLRAHVAIQVDGFGLLVCGGTSEQTKSFPSTECYIFKHDTGKWQNFYQLNVGRLNAYITQIDNTIHIIGGSSSNPFNPCLNTEEVLNLAAIDYGWQKHEATKSLCSKSDEEIVEIKCK